MDNELKLILVSPQYGLCQAWDKRFADLPNVEIVSGTFQSLPEFDCMVSAANSFGLMDGGVDLAIIRFFGQVLMTRVQQRILDDYLGEQPIGTSMIVPTNHARHPYLAHTPTMRIPMEIQHTDNVYLAMWAMLLAVHRPLLSLYWFFDMNAVIRRSLLVEALPATQSTREAHAIYRELRRELRIRTARKIPY